MSKAKVLNCALWAMAMVGLAAMPAVAQPTFSIDFQGPTIGIPDPSGLVITEGDILMPAFGWPAPGPLPPPVIFIPAGPAGSGLGLWTYPFPVEVDALSYGRDVLCGYWHFSVDEFANGLLTPSNLPSVLSEGASGNQEACADIFVGLRVLVHPTVAPPPPGTILDNLDVIDGDGLPPFGGPGIGLIEPNPPRPGFPDQGDNLDALDLDLEPVGTDMPVFFSLDSHFVDPIEGFPANLGTALLNGFVGGDVLMSFWGGPPRLYAPAWMLGLDLEGEDTDDLDALVLVEDGDLQYNPRADFIAFSVRRGSGVIGMPDSIWGVPISEGDILVPPPPMVGAPPGILVPGEALGLDTLRTNPVSLITDDLNALDVMRLAGDCDGDGVVSVFDVIIVVNAFGSVPGDINWDPRADLDCDNDVDVFDVITVINNFGNHW